MGYIHGTRQIGLGWCVEYGLEWPRMRYERVSSLFGYVGSSRLEKGLRIDPRGSFDVFNFYNIFLPDSEPAGSPRHLHAPPSPSVENASQ